MSDQNITIRKIPTEYGMQWLKSSWALSKKNYALALGLGIFYIFGAMVLSPIPFLGTILIAVMAGIIGAGHLIVVSKWVRSEPTQFKDIFQAFSNQPLLKRMGPYFIFMVVINLPGTLSPKLFVGAAAGGAGGLYVLVMMAISIATWFSLPLMVFKGKSFFETIPLSVNAILTNIVPVIYAIVLIIILSVVTAIPLGIPVVFFTLPLMMSLGYIAYASVFEGLNLPEGITPAQIKESQPTAD